jgi:hypothetical protein
VILALLFRVGSGGGARDFRMVDLEVVEGASMEGEEVEGDTKAKRLGCYIL